MGYDGLRIAYVQVNISWLSLYAAGDASDFASLIVVTKLAGRASDFAVR
jgi:hypothetical protein